MGFILYLISVYLNRLFYYTFLNTKLKIDLSNYFKSKHGMYLCELRKLAYNLHSWVHMALLWVFRIRIRSLIFISIYRYCDITHCYRAVDVTLGTTYFISLSYVLSSHVGKCTCEDNTEWLCAFFNLYRISWTSSRKASLWGLTSSNIMILCIK